MTAPPDDWIRKDKLLNWAGCYEYSVSPENLHQPKSVEEVQELIRRVEKIRVLGTRHCFHGIADSTHNILWTVNLDQIHKLDKQACTVTVGPGIRYGSLSLYLHNKGFALKNLASLPHISVGGAVATATHGSGCTIGCLSTAVSAIEIVKANGDVVNVHRDAGDTDFQGLVVSLGSIGVITKITLDLVPTFTIKQDVYMDLPMGVLEDYFLQIMSSGYSVSLFTDWSDKNINQVWVKSVVDTTTMTNNPVSKIDLEVFGAKKLVDIDVHPILQLSNVHCTEQRGVPGTWFERLPHFKIGFMPSAAEELQSEYFIPIEHAYEAIMAVESLHEKITPLLWISEIRVVDSDDLWMSPCFKRKCVAIHFTWKQNMDSVKKLLTEIEKQLVPFKVRPHWGKLFNFSYEHLATVYEKLKDFRDLLKKYDPNGKFRNDFIDCYIFGKNPI